jgi:hypothetical protein
VVLLGGGRRREVCCRLGHCCLSKQYSGLGIPNLLLMGFALRLRWLWLARVDVDKTWLGYSFRVDKASQEFFDTSITMQVGDGSHAVFWMDCWLNGCSIRQLALNLR